MMWQALAERLVGTAGCPLPTVLVSTADSPSLFVLSGPRSGPLGTQNQDKYLPEAYLAPALAKSLFKTSEWKLPGALGEILGLHL